jgi:Zn-dependent protease
MFITMLKSNPQLFFMQIFLVVFSVCCHEYAHAQVALWEGDTTARDEGHLTLNPLKQMGTLSLVLLAFIGIAWGAVPVNPQRMRRRLSPLLVSLAGPGTNLLLYVMFTVLLHGYLTSQKIPMNEIMSHSAALLFFLGAILNFILFVFNMLPVPPLDGFAVFQFFSHRRLDEHSELVKGFFVCLILAVIFGMNYVFKFGAWLTLHWGIWLGLY